MRIEGVWVNHELLTKRPCVTDVVIIRFSWDGNESHQSFRGSSLGDRYPASQLQHTDRCAGLPLFSWKVRALERSFFFP